jgi:hypothetical protein
VHVVVGELPRGAQDRAPDHMGVWSDAHPRTLGSRREGAQRYVHTHQHGLL